MKWYVVTLVIGLTTIAHAKEMMFNVQPKSFKTMPVLVAVVDANHSLEKMAHVIKDDLELSGQCTATIRKYPKQPSAHQMQQLAAQGYPLALFLNNTYDDASIEWRIYETNSNSMIKGRKYSKKTNNYTVWAHHVADNVWPELTGQEGCFSTKIAFCKQVKDKKNNNYKHVYMIDMDGKNERALVKNPTIAVAPRWNVDSKRPLLFYSECTNSNIRMMVTPLDGTSKVASNFDGLNMLPAFNADGSKVVYCASRGNGSCQIYQFGNGDLKRITNNDGTNVSPTFGPEGYLYFCSDYQTGSPLLYSYEFATGKTTPITHSGYCASPCYSRKTNKIVYAKLIEGCKQLFTYNVATKMHSQLTFDPSNKEECSWSPCGNYIAYCNESQGKSQIKMMHVKTGRIKNLTPANQLCTYPTWSGALGGLDEVTC